MRALPECNFAQRFVFRRLRPVLLAVALIPVQGQVLVAQQCPASSSSTYSVDFEVTAAALSRGSEVTTSLNVVGRRASGGVFLRRGSEPAAGFANLAVGLSAGIQTRLGGRALLCARSLVDWERGPHDIVLLGDDLDAAHTQIDLALGGRAFERRERVILFELGLSSIERRAVYRRGNGSTLPPTRQHMRILASRLLLVLQLDSVYTVTVGIARRDGVPFTKTAPIAYSDGDAALIIGARYRLRR